MRRILVSLAAAMVILAGTPALAAETISDHVPVKREIIPGSELMTSQERENYRQRMRAVRTPQEQEQVRAAHVMQMRARARLRGLQLADPGEKK